MKFKNETKEDVLIPVIFDKKLPSSKLVIKDGETKDVPDCAIVHAKTVGLTPVEEIKEVPVEAEESSISKVKVETKKIKKSKKKAKRS